MSMESLAVAVEGSYNLRPRGALAGSPLLRGLLTVMPREVFEKEVLSLLSETDLAMLSRCSRDCREAVVASGLPRAGAPETGGAPLNYARFVRSTNMLSWANTSGCPWDARVCCAVIALCPPAHRLEVLSFARENNCPLDEHCIMFAVSIQSVEVMTYLRKNGCPYHPETLSHAVVSKRDSPSDDDDMTFLQFILDDGAPRSTQELNECCAAAATGRLTTLKWLRERGFLWNKLTPFTAAAHGNLNIIEYCWSNNCPWSKEVFISALMGSRCDLPLPQDDDEEERLLRRERCTNVLTWLDANGCPKPDDIGTIRVMFQNADGSYAEYSFTENDHD